MKKEKPRGREWRKDGATGRPSPDSLPGRNPAWTPAHRTGSSRAPSSLGRRAARVNLSLGLTNPQIPAPGWATGSKEAFLRSVSWGQVTLSSSAPKPAPHSPQGPAKPKPGKGMRQATELHDLLSPGSVPAVPDLVSTRLPTLSRTDRLWVGLLGLPGGARVQMSRQALGGARPLISQAV